MSWISERIEKFRQMPTPYLYLHITAKVLGGLGLGVLLATWLPTWTWWIFIILAVLISIPSTIMVLRK